MRGLFAGEGETSRRGGREGDAKFGFALLHPDREFQRDHDFTDADGVQPGRAAIGQPGARLSIIEAESLPEFVPVIAAPEHLHDVGRQKEEKGNWEEEIVQKADRVRHAEILQPAG